MRLIRPVTVDVESDVLTSTNVSETETLWDDDEGYDEGDAVYLVIDGVHQRFVSLVDMNVGNDPETSPDEWEATGPTNRWAMFDSAVQTQTKRADSIAVSFQMPAAQRIDTLALLNVAGTEAHVTVTDAVEGVVYDQAHSLVSFSGITDWFAWFNEPIVRKQDLVLTDLPPGYPAAEVSVSITEPGSTVACGACLVGFSRQLGDTQWGGSLRIRDYSVKNENDFGEMFVVERAYKRRANFSVIVPMGFVNELMTLLPQYRARPVLWIANGALSATAVYGYFKDFNVELSLPPSRALCSLELESLV